MAEPGYPIRAVSKLTGLSIDTLRAWERRYQAIRPLREGRGRRYQESDVLRLNLLREAVEKGHSIGQIAALSDTQLKELTGRSRELRFQAEKSGPRLANRLQPDLQPILTAIENFDYPEADRELGRLAATVSSRELIYNVVIPMMKEVGDRWYKGSFSIAQEHMVSAILRNLLGALMRLYTPANATHTILLATPSNEQHEFGILAAAMLATRGGLGVVYLGAGLPVAEIVTAAEKSQPQAVLLGIKGTSGVSKAVVDLQYLSEHLARDTELWVGGAESEDLIKEIRKTRAVFLEDFIALERQLARFGAQI